SLLEREQLVRRERDPADGRAYRVVLTDKARRFQPVAERTLDELGALAQERLGERRLAAPKHHPKGGNGTRKHTPALQPSGHPETRCSTIWLTSSGCPSGPPSSRASSATSTAITRS